MSQVFGVVVFKVGGSLLELDDLPARLNGLLAGEASSHRLLIIGGGKAADEVRAAAERFPVSADAAHWLAIKAMSSNAKALAPAIDRGIVLDHLGHCLDAWGRGQIVIFDPLPMLLGEPGSLPIGWHVTSDSIAAHVARRLDADRLVLLKSVGGDEDLRVETAIERGWLDSHFPHEAGGLTVYWRNLRAPSRESRLILHSS